MQKRKNVIAALGLAVILAFAGCGPTAAGVPGITSSSSGVQSQSYTSSSPLESIDGAGNTTVEIQPSANTAPQGGQSTFQYSDVPAYNNAPAVKMNGNDPYFTNEFLNGMADGTEFYSELDSLGRCGETYAKVGVETMPTQTRGEIGMVKPSGWKTVKYPGVVDGNYLYNRCHLIGYQLAGENANPKNLITGTRYLNVAGMLPYENLVADYVKATGHHVYYRVTPYYTDNNLVANGVLMEGQSEEDNGVRFCVWIYNVQPGVTIDYKTGDSSLQNGYSGGSQGNEMPEAMNNGTFTPRQAGNYSDRDTNRTPNAVTAAPDDGHNYNGDDYKAQETTTYVINKNTKKFHKPDCPSVKKMSSGNTEETTKTRDELIAEGYEPCGICKP